MPEPALGRAALLIDPEARAALVTRDVVVTRDILAIPPSRFDTLGSGFKDQCPAVARRMLIRGFVAETLETMPNETFRTHMYELVDAKLADLRRQPAA